MKIRTGFVSNSSSTSFCVIGLAITDSDVYDGKLKNPEDVLVIGGFGNDGLEVFQLTKSKYDMLRESIETPACHGQLTFLVDHMFYESGNKINANHVKAGMEIHCGECTINEVDDVSFEENYIKGEGDMF